LVAVSLKLESFQHGGSFKPRGACNNLVGGRIPEAGIAAASGGNHGAAVAYAARMLKLPVQISVPGISSPAKVARISGYGATVVQGGTNCQEALGRCQSYVAQSGALNLYAYDTKQTIDGHSTLAQELEQQAQILIQSS